MLDSQCHPAARNCQDTRMNNLGGLGSQYCEHLFDPLKCHSVDTKEDRDIHDNGLQNVAQDVIHMVFVPFHQFGN
jgi:hypothetical protein